MTQVSLPPKKLLPYDDHFHPRTHKHSTHHKPESRRLGHPLVSASIVPHEDQVRYTGNAFISICSLTLLVDWR